MNEERRYPQIDEEDGSSLMASEPAIAYATELITQDDDIDYNFGFHDFGLPRTLEDVRAELREAEAAWDDPTQWCTSEEMWAEIKKTFPWANIR